MSNPGNFSNNPLYTDITKLDHLSPQPVFTYSWNTGDARWEPAGGGLGEGGGSVEISNLNELLSGLASGINLGSTSPTGQGINIDRADAQPWKLVTKTVNQKIEEDFILMENIPDEERFGTYSGNTYGVDRFIMDDIYNTHYENGRTNPSTPETGHPNYFILAEDADPNRGVQQDGTFHTDTAYALRYDNEEASLINSYELKDFTKLYELGLVDNITLLNESPYPIQFHTIDETYDSNKTTDPENNNILFLNSDTSVKINSDEASRIFIKRPHTISGFMMKYTLTYKETGLVDTYN
tara:strand:+ start:384 stop:1271 length:888 start_codon:yes stop_codon:yes gene_type:complete